MTIRACFITVLTALNISVACSQTLQFRNGVFLHHSTGGCIWGPNGSTTSVPKEITAYNQQHGLTGQSAVALSETGWPVTPWNNEWERWHLIFENRDTVLADLRPILLSQRIIIIKSCFPSSDMTGYGTSGDTLSPTRKTTYNYKWHWRSIVRAMRQRPSNFFVIWTNAPLVAASTSDLSARLSDQFCRWAKDTLARGLDAEFGAFPPNVYVFDFFHKLAGSDGKIPPEYVNSPSDSHPNGTATLLVAPAFVREVFDAALAYESVTMVSETPAPSPETFVLHQNYPNPFNPATVLSYTLRENSFVVLKVFDGIGRAVSTPVMGMQNAGEHHVIFDATGFSAGAYFYSLAIGSRSSTRRMVLLR